MGNRWFLLSGNYRKQYAMKHQFLGRVLASLLMVACGFLLAQGQKSTNSTPLTNAAVVKLVKAGFKERTIASIIGTRPSNFDLSPDRMIELKRNGVSERLILAMISRQEGMDVDMADDSWGNDTFFNQGVDTKRNEQSRAQVPNDGSSTEIFGSSGGVKGQTRSRGQNGSIANDTITTGSATVKIIRPPAESNTPPKLEKTPALTNASVIELVEAGFSDGTIIRRIEQSPVQFDLSPGQLNELRNRRVSDKLLGAMQNAMGMDSGSTKSTGSPNDKPKKQN
jgi:hypothetical protein